jgi:hypothetical protein
MSERKVVSAKDFINKAVKVVEIDGFEQGEKFDIKIKPVSLLGMMTKGKLPNELKAQIASMFADNKPAVKDNKMNITNMEELALMQELMDKVCEESMVEPKYSEVGEYMTHAQKTQVFMHAQGNVQEYIPSDEEQ